MGFIKNMKKTIIQKRLEELEKKDTFCTECGKKVIYKGIVKSSYKGRVFFNENTGRPLFKFTWSCPENEKFWSSSAHSDYYKMLSDKEVEVYIKSHEK